MKPSLHEIIPGKLSAKVFEHGVQHAEGTSKSLAYLTQGFEALGLQEILLVVMNKEKQYEVSNDPFHFFELTFEAALDGRPASVSDVAQFGQDSIYGWKGAMFVAPPFVIDDVMPANCLCLILLSQKETLNVPALGYQRILAMLGQSQLYYPYPYWNNLDRREIDVDDIVEKSITAKLSRVNFPLGTVSASGNDITFKIPKRIPNGALPKQVVDPSTPVVFFLSLDRQTDGCLVWNGQGQSPAAITKDAGKQPESLSGCMLIVVGEQQKNSAQMAEDGFYLALNDDGWRKFWETLIKKRPLTIKPSDGTMSFSVKWT